jgi:hypothetical protein
VGTRCETDNGVACPGVEYGVDASGRGLTWCAGVERGRDGGWFVDEDGQCREVDASALPSRESSMVVRCSGPFLVSVSVNTPLPI